MVAVDESVSCLLWNYHSLKLCPSIGKNHSPCGCFPYFYNFKKNNYKMVDLPSENRVCAKPRTCFICEYFMTKLCVNNY